MTDMLATAFVTASSDVAVLASAAESTEPIFVIFLASLVKSAVPAFIFCIAELN